jgi:hypothetical protein
MGRADGRAEVVEPIPDLDDQQQARPVEAKQHVDRAGRGRRLRRELEVAGPPVARRGRQNELLNREMAGIARLGRRSPAE